MTVPRVALLAALVLLAAYVWGNSLPEAAGLIPTPWDKLTHLLWYATLAGLLLLGLVHRAWPWVLVGTLLLAGWDEWHQFALPGRSPDFDDWQADALGVLAGMVVSHAIGRRFWAAWLCRIIGACCTDVKRASPTLSWLCLAKMNTAIDAGEDFETIYCT